MTEALTRVFAFDFYAARHERPALVSPGVTIVTRRAASMFNLRGDSRDASFMREVSSTFDVGLPIEPNTAAGTDGTRALWLGPDEWLIVSENRGQTPFLQHEKRGLSSVLAKCVLTDVSHGRAALRLSGRDARDVLARGCPLDLHPSRFPVNGCAQTAIAKINVVIDHVQSGVFDLYCPRSYAGSFWHWLHEAAAEYGCNVARSA